MRKRISFSFIYLVFLVFLFSCVPPGQPAGPGFRPDAGLLPSGETGDPETPFFQAASPGGFVPGEIIVKISSSADFTVLDGMIPGERIQTRVTSAETGYVVYRLYNPAEVPDVVVALSSCEGVLAAERNVYFNPDFIPSDPCYGDYQYAAAVTFCEEAWDIEKGEDSGIVVAVVDSGINGEHEELSGRVLGGWDIMENHEIPPGVNSDINGHGTHVAGIIAAAGNNGTGIAGVAWGVKLLPVKIFARDRYTTAADVAAGLFWAVENGADVVNMSLGSGLYSMAVADAVNFAFQQNVVVVTSMGNDYTRKIKYPAALAGVIAVGSSNAREEISDFSTIGDHISVVAPGESIYSLNYAGNTQYMFASGTSMSSPYVAGIAALLLTHNPGLTPGEVRSIIEDSADPLGKKDFSSSYGHGRVNVKQALELPPRDNCTSVTVDVTNKGLPLGGVKVLLEDAATKSIIQSGLTSYGDLPASVNGRVVFHFIPRGNYTIHVHVGESREKDIDLNTAGDVTETFAFDTPVILVINGIKNTDNSLLTDDYLYARRLTDMGKYCTFWKNAFYGPPTLSLMTSYDQVIWFSGRTMDNPANGIEVLTAAERDVLRDYMDGGGRLFICGNNIAESLSLRDPVFLRYYLHAEYVAPVLDYDELKGSGFLEDMEVQLFVDTDDEIAPAPGAVGVLDASDDSSVNNWAAISWEGHYRLVFSSICPNEILYNNPGSFLEDIVSWLEEEE